MSFYYKSTRRRVNSINDMVEDDIIYDLQVASGNFIAGSYILFGGKLVRVASPASSVPQGMAAGRIFRSGQHEFRLIGQDSSGRELLEEVSSNFISRFQVRSPESSGTTSIIFDTVDFGPSDFVDLNNGVFTLASGISHELRAGALIADRACLLQWGYVDESGDINLVGSSCGTLGSGVCGGNAVYTTIPNSTDISYALFKTDSSARITDCWATVASQYSLQTISPIDVPSGVSPPTSTPSGTVPSSGFAPPPTGVPLMGLSYDASGYTTLVASGTTIYVSSISGSDSNDGLSPSTPKLSLDAATATVGNGNHRILLERGGVYSNVNKWNRSGLSREYPLIISAYGTGEQPRLRIQSLFNQISWLALIDVHVYLCKFYKGGNGILIERCLVTALSVQGDALDAFNWLTPLTGLYVRFCKILDSGAPGFSLYHGVFTVNVFDAVYEYNVWDHNGWTPGILRSDPPASGAPSQLKHNAYFNLPGGPVTFRFNIVKDASSHGVHQRTGGVNEWNLYIHNPLSQLGYAQDGKLVFAPSGVPGYIGNNVAVTATDIAPPYPRGMFFILENVNGCIIENNIACLSGPDSNGNKAMFRPLMSNGYLNDISYINNISYQWSQSPAHGIQLLGVGNAPTNITVSGNDFESGLVTYANPSGALAYATDEFMSGCRVSGIIIGSSTDPTLIINNIKAMFTPV